MAWKTIDRSPSRPAGASRRPSRVRALGRDSRGFTLVEVLVATLMMVTSLVAVAQLLAVSRQMHTRGTRWTEASRLATSKVDEMMKLSLATAPAIQISPVSPDPLGQNVANYFDLPAPGLTRRWRVQAGPTANTRRVTIVVTPTVPNRLTGQAVTLTTIVRQW